MGCYLGMSFNKKRYSRLTNRTAGASREHNEARGKHNLSRWKSGDNWVECQRCGHDVYSSEAMEDGYTRGLIVCPKCYDPPHPQDYVRAYEDRISPAGYVTGAVDYDRTGAVGSTEVPEGTFPIGGNPEDTGITPDEVTGSSCLVWWDWSVDEYSFQTSDEVGDNVVDEASIANTINRFAPTDELGVAVSYSSRDVEWVENAQNSLGAANFVLDTGSTVSLEAGGLSSSTCPGAFQPLEVFIVYQISTDTIDQHGMFSHTAATGHRFVTLDDENGQVGQVGSVWNDEIFPNYQDFTDLQPSVSADGGNWYVGYWKFDDVNCAYQINGTVPTGGAVEIAAHDANADEPFDVVQNGLRIGAICPSQGGSTAPVSQWDGMIGEVVAFGNTTSHNNEGGLSGDEISGLITSLMLKWNITTEVA